MVSYKDYFEKNRYKPKYYLGDRIIGKWNKIPFVGTVGNDSVVSEDDGPRISVMLDLPIKHRGEIKTIIWCKHKDVRKFPEWTEKSLDTKKPKRVTKKS